MRFAKFGYYKDEFYEFLLLTQNHTFDIDKPDKIGGRFEIIQICPQICYSIIAIVGIYYEASIYR